MNNKSTHMCITKLMTRTPQLPAVSRHKFFIYLYYLPGYLPLEIILITKKKSINEFKKEKSK